SAHSAQASQTARPLGMLCAARSAAKDGRQFVQVHPRHGLAAPGKESARGGAAMPYKVHIAAPAADAHPWDELPRGEQPAVAITRQLAAQHEAFQIPQVFVVRVT